MPDEQQSMKPPSSPGRRGMVFRIVLSLALVAIIFAWVLPQFIDYELVWLVIRTLSGWQWLALLGATLLWLLAEWWATMAVLPGLTLRQAGATQLASLAVSSVIPGPVGAGVRWGMYDSYGFGSSAIALALIFGGALIILVNLALPVVAIALLVAFGGGVNLVGVALLAVVAFGGVIVVLVLVLRSETFAQSLGNRLGSAWSWVLARFRRPPVTDLGSRTVRLRGQALGLLRTRWQIATASTVVAQMAPFLVLLSAVRFVGVDGTELKAVDVFAAYAVARLLTVIPITPGNAGVTELALIGVMAGRADGPSANEIAAAAFIHRVFTWILPAILGGGVLLWRAARRRPAEEKVESQER